MQEAEEEDNNLKLSGALKAIVLITITREHAAIPVLNKPLLITFASFTPPPSPPLPQGIFF